LQEDDICRRAGERRLCSKNEVIGFRESGDTERSAARPDPVVQISRRDRLLSLRVAVWTTRIGPPSTGLRLLADFRLADYELKH